MPPPPVVCCGGGGGGYGGGGGGCGGGGGGFGGGGCGRRRKREAAIQPHYKTDLDTPCPQLAWREIVEKVKIQTKKYFKNKNSYKLK
jgi:hypothetical protein